MAKIKVLKEVEVKTLVVEAGARYWEDATVDGVEDENGDLIPCRDGDYWKPIIDLETGIITNWTQGVTADIYYKVCDDGTYKLLDVDGNEVVSIDGYVPDIMCPNGEGFGDYIIMKVGENGKIDNWKVGNLSEFSQEEE